MQLRKRGGVPALLPSDGALGYLLLESKRARQAGPDCVVGQRGSGAHAPLLSPVGVEQALQRVAQHDRASAYREPKETLHRKVSRPFLPYIELVGAGHL